MAVELRRRFEGKVVLVTGSASGIGRATALLLSEQGAHINGEDVRVDGGMQA